MLSLPVAAILHSLSHTDPWEAESVPPEMMTDPEFTADMYRHYLKQWRKEMDTILRQAMLSVDDIMARLVEMLPREKLLLDPKSEPVTTYLAACNVLSVMPDAPEDMKATLREVKDLLDMLRTSCSGGLSVALHKLYTEEHGEQGGEQTGDFRPWIAAMYSRIAVSARWVDRYLFLLIKQCCSHSKLRRLTTTITSASA